MYMSKVEKMLADKENVVYKKLKKLACEIFSEYEVLLVEYVKGRATEEDKCKLFYLAKALNRDIEKDSKSKEKDSFYECLTWEKMINDLK